MVGRIIAQYASASSARQAIEALIRAGFPEERIEVIALGPDGRAVTGPPAATSEVATLWAALHDLVTGADEPSDAVRLVVSGDDAELNRALPLLDGHRPAELRRVT